MVQSELAAGRKRTHWMWFVFPQIKGLGSSPTAQRFAISNLEAAAAYLEHPVLGRRLEQSTALVNSLQNRSVQEIFGYPDDLKFHASMTLFAKVADCGHFGTPVFGRLWRNTSWADWTRSRSADSVPDIVYCPLESWSLEIIFTLSISLSGCRGFESTSIL